MIPGVRRTHARSVTTRLFAGLLPALLALAITLALAYYGEYGRQAPEIVVTTSALLALASLILTWRNARYLAARIARVVQLTGSGESDDGDRTVRSAAAILAGDDELMRIEHTVGSLSAALLAAQKQRDDAERSASARVQSQATLLAATVRITRAHVDDVRLPLHILLESKFGAMNENQEEMLAIAHDAADTLDDALRQLSDVADADRDALLTRRELVQVNDVARAILPMAAAAASRRLSCVEDSLQPGLPRVLADRVRLAQALAILCTDAASVATATEPLRITTVREGGGVRLSLSPAGSTGDSSATPSLALAERLIALQHGTVRRTPEALEILLRGE